ncbi:MAG: hypothetical protein R3290_03705 [Acidimicrobiia bacterium]|nr:hypothetical protein [Acidimicrobiia bacterium]
MNRLPNPWVLVPVVVAAVAGGVVGGLVTEISCRPGSCIPLAVAIGTIAAVAAAVGTVTIVVLALRSIAEWREADPADEPAEADPGPPTC